MTPQSSHLVRKFIKRRHEPIDLRISGCHLRAVTCHKVFTVPTQLDEMVDGVAFARQDPILSRALCEPPSRQVVLQSAGIFPTDTKTEQIGTEVQLALAALRAGTERGITARLFALVPKDGARLLSTRSQD